MKLKILTLLICFSFNFLHSSKAAVDVKKKENITVLESSTKNTPTVKSNKKWKWFQKKRKFKKRKFRLFNFLKWKKKKRKKQQEVATADNRKVSVLAVLSCVITLMGTLLFLFAPFDFYIILKLVFIIFGGIVGVGGLVGIRKNPDEKKGEVLALIGIMGLVIFVLILFQLRLLQRFDF